jgi:hypothetical protein
LILNLGLLGEVALLAQADQVVEGVGLTHPEGTDVVNIGVATLLLPTVLAGITITLPCQLALDLPGEAVLVPTEPPG